MTAAPSLTMTSVLAASLFLLAACSAGSFGPAGNGAGAETGKAPPPPVGAADSEQPAPPIVANPLPEPQGTSQPPPPAASSGEPVIIKGPDGTTWTAKSPKSQDAYRADLEDCYSYAAAQTRHDAQITDDRNAGIDTLTSQSRYSALRKRVDEYDLRNRRIALMSSCMESKGYASANSVLPRLDF